jgi:hypothetical protein
VSTYLERLKAKIQQKPIGDELSKLSKAPSNSETPIPRELPKLSKAPSDSFRSSSSRRISRTDDAGRLEELAALPCPADLQPARWEGIRTGALRFAERWASQALALGWASEELFGLHEPFANYSRQGGAWFIGDATIVGVTTAAITVRTKGGSIQRVYRRSAPTTAKGGHA